MLNNDKITEYMARHHIAMSLIKANKILNRRGDFWQHDYYNHIIRSHQSYLYQIRYIWDNPENAGFKNWSSRWKKKQQE